MSRIGGMQHCQQTLSKCSKRRMRTICGLRERLGKRYGYIAFISRLGFVLKGL